MKMSLTEAKKLIVFLRDVIPQNIDRIVNNKLDGVYKNIKIEFVEDYVYFTFPNTPKGSLDKTIVYTYLVKLRNNLL